MIKLILLCLLMLPALSQAQQAETLESCIYQNAVDTLSLHKSISKSKPQAKMISAEDLELSVRKACLGGESLFSALSRSTVESNNVINSSIRRAIYDVIINPIKAL